MSERGGEVIEGAIQHTQTHTFRGTSCPLRPIQTHGEKRLFIAITCRNRSKKNNNQNSNLASDLRTLKVIFCYGSGGNSDNWISVLLSIVTLLAVM